MADRMAVLDAGHVAQVGEPRALYTRPATRFVAGFIGETNFIEGRVVGVGAEEQGSGGAGEKSSRGAEEKSSRGAEEQGSGGEVSLAPLLPCPLAGSGGWVEVETAVGKIVSTACADGLQVGDRVTCSVRPEALTVVSGDPPPEDNVISGKVEDVMYLGEIEQYFLKLDDGSSVKVVESSPDAPKARVGERASAAFSPERVVVLKE